MGGGGVGWGEGTHVHFVEGYYLTFIIPSLLKTMERISERGLSLVSYM